jgi:TonB family protein
VAVTLTLRVFKDGAFVAAKDYDRDTIKIGRLSTAHLCLDDEKVSRIHSVIEVAPDGALSITDMGSVEGTFVNGKRVNKVAIQFGDEVRVGNTTIKVEKANAIPAISPSVAELMPVTSASTGGGAGGLQVSGREMQTSPMMPIPKIAPPPVAPPMVSSSSSVSGVQNESTGSGVRALPRRRKGTGPLGLELRFRWGDQIVAEHFFKPESTSTFTIGSKKGVQFEMGEGRFGADSFELVRYQKGTVALRFTGKMKGELHRKFGDEILTLNQAREKGHASADGDAYALNMGSDDFAWVDVGGGITVEAFFQPEPKAVLVPFAETVDFTVLNIFLVCFFLFALFSITAANLDAAGDAFDDELNSDTARIAKLLIKPPEKKNSILEKFEKKKDSGEIAAKHKGDEGKMGKKDAPNKSAHAAPKGDPTNKDQARMLLNKVFGGQGSGVSTIFGHQGLGGELKAAMGNMFGAAAGDAAGLSGLGVRGSGSGGGGLGDSIGIGGIGTKGRGGGTGGYGSGVGAIGGKKDVDIGITSSDPIVMGSLDKELIRKVIHANRGQIRYCYESQLSRFPKLTGKVSIKFVITGAGTVSTSQVAQSTAGNAEMEACIAGRVRTWQFPKPKGGGVVVVTYPFIFKASGE